MLINIPEPIWTTVKIKIEETSETILFGESTITLREELLTVNEKVNPKRSFVITKAKITTLAGGYMRAEGVFHRIRGWSQTISMVIIEGEF